MEITTEMVGRAWTALRLLGHFVPLEDVRTILEQTHAVDNPPVRV